MFLAQADLANTIGTAGPIAIITAVLGFLLKAYLDKRKDDREVIRVERESESGIVETTAQALKIVREQMVSMGTDMATLRQENVEKERRINDLEERVRELEEENRLLRVRRGGRHVRGQGPGDAPRTIG